MTASAALLAALVPLDPVAARGQSSIKKLSQRLKAGGYVWQPERAKDGSIEIVISLPRQLAYVYRAGKLIGASTVSSGKAGHESPVGRFQILEKRRTHRSNRYSDAPMPYMQRLNWFGVALHGGVVPGHAASRGCIRLPMAFAKKLFEVTALGGFVFVADADLGSPKAALKLARRHASTPLGPDRSLRGG